MMAVQRDQWACVSFVNTCRSNHTCQPEVDEFSIASIFDDCKRDVAKRNMAKRDGEGSELLVRKVEEFCFVKEDQEWGNGLAYISEAIWLAEISCIKWQSFLASYFFDKLLMEYEFVLFANIFLQTAEKNTKPNKWFCLKF